MAIKITSKPLLIGATVASLACGIAGYAWLEEHRKPILEIYVFDLKSGSSVFVRTPDDRRILVDGGANSEVIRELTGILPFYSRRIDMIVATNSGGKDSGLIDVLERYSVDKVVVPGISLQDVGLSSSTDQIYATFIDTVKRLKVHLEEVLAGDSIDFGKDVVAKVLFPVASTSFDYSKASGPEIILKISYGQNSVLILGNATTKVQKFLISSKSAVNDLGADVLIVPHSASASSLANELMDKMRPKYLIYSQSATASSKKSVAAKDPPSKKKKVDPLYFILDDKRFNLKEKGTVKIISDGSNIAVSQ